MPAMTSWRGAASSTAITPEAGTATSRQRPSAAGALPPLAWSRCRTRWCPCGCGRSRPCPTQGRRSWPRASTPSRARRRPTQGGEPRGLQVVQPRSSCYDLDAPAEAHKAGKRVIDPRVAQRLLFHNSWKLLLDGPGETCVESNTISTDSSSKLLQEPAFELMSANFEGALSWPKYGQTRPHLIHVGDTLDGNAPSSKCSISSPLGPGGLHQMCGSRFPEQLRWSCPSALHGCAARFDQGEPPGCGRGAFGQRLPSLASWDTRRTSPSHALLVRK